VSRGFQVPRRRQLPSAIPLLAGALAASLILAAGREASAQTANGGMNAASNSAADDGGGNGTASLLLRPVLDGSPQNPPRFRSPRKGMDNAPSRFGQLPNFDYQPAFGAGTSGFDSTNARKRNTKSSQGAKPGGAGDSAPQPQDSTGSSADPTAKADAPAVTPKQLQPASGLIAARLRLQNRPGAPPTNADAVPATFATTVPSLRPLPEERPFDPLGIQVGAFNFRPAMEYTRGWDGNAPRNATPPAASSWFNVYAPELLVNSNWDRHELTATLRGSYTTYDTMHSLDRPSADARVNARIDVTSLSRIDLEGRYLLFTDYLGSPNIQAGLAHLPIGMDYGATVGFGQRFNRFDVTLKGLVDRTVYNDSEFTDGTSASNAGRNFNRYGSQLRTSYEVMPGARPFVEIGVDDRAYDLAIDAAGAHRSSEGYYGKVGTTLAFAGKLIGEISAGYLARNYHDPTLENIRGWTVDSSLLWLATALTSVKLINTTTVAESTLSGVSGAFTRETTLQVDHAFRRWLVATLRLTRGFDDYVGSTREDIRYVAATTLAYSLTRELWLRGEYRQEWRHSNTPGNDYFAQVWLVGLRLQR
jgi:hypothetical protein